MHLNEIIEVFGAIRSISITKINDAIHIGITFEMFKRAF
jgi:hypothetical protein